MMAISFYLAVLAGLHLLSGAAKMPNRSPRILMAAKLISPYRQFMWALLLLVYSLVVWVKLP